MATFLATCLETMVYNILRLEQKEKEARLSTSIHDLMRHAGVGRASVYRVLTGSGSVGEKARGRVMKAIAELGRPALKRRAKVSARVALWVPGIGELVGCEHHVSLVRALNEEAARRGVIIEMLNAPVPERPAQAVDLVRRAKVRGVMVMSFYSEEHLAALADEWPVAMFFACGHCRRLTAVEPDDFAAGFLSTRCLIERGHRRIAAIVGGGRKPQGFSQRFTGGYALALAEARLAFEDALVLRDGANLGPFNDECPEPPACREIAEMKSPPTAFVGRGETIVNLMRGLTARGFGKPGDFQAVGYGPDGTEPWPSSGVSWVGYSVRDMAEAGLDALDARGAAPRSLTIPVHLAPAKASKALRET